MEREAITDSMLKIQSIQASLAQVDHAKIDDLDEIHDCLANADSTFRDALRSDPTRDKRPKR